MGKRLFLIICFSLFGAYLGSSVLMATDQVDLVRVNDTKTVETVPLPEPIKQTNTVTSSNSSKIVKAPTAGASSLPVAPQMRNYTVGIFSNEMIAHNLSYSALYKTGKLIYGHNTANLLGNLGGLQAGELFTVTEAGTTTTYRVSGAAIYEKTADGYLNSDPYLMGAIMQTAMGHNLALMTCAGTSYGNGDASHRLVVYADAV